MNPWERTGYPSSFRQAQSPSSPSSPSLSTSSASPSRSTGYNNNNNNNAITVSSPTPSVLSALSSPDRSLTPSPKRRGYYSNSYGISIPQSNDIYSPSQQGDSRIQFHSSPGWISSSPSPSSSPSRSSSPSSSTRPSPSRKSPSPRSLSTTTPQKVILIQSFDKSPIVSLNRRLPIAVVREYPPTTQLENTDDNSNSNSNNQPPQKVKVKVVKRTLKEVLTKDAEKVDTVSNSSSPPPPLVIEEKAKEIKTASITKKANTTTTIKSKQPTTTNTNNKSNIPIRKQSSTSSLQHARSVSSIRSSFSDPSIHIVGTGTGAGNNSSSRSRSGTGSSGTSNLGSGNKSKPVTTKPKLNTSKPVVKVTPTPTSTLRNNTKKTTTTETVKPKRPVTAPVTKPTTTVTSSPEKKPKVSVKPNTPSPTKPPTSPTKSTTSTRSPSRSPSRSPTKRSPDPSPYTRPRPLSPYFSRMADRILKDDDEPHTTLSSSSDEDDFHPKPTPQPSQQRILTNPEFVSFRTRLRQKYLGDVGRDDSESSESSDDEDEWVRGKEKTKNEIKAKPKQPFTTTTRKPSPKHTPKPPPAPTDPLSTDQDQDISHLSDRARRILEKCALLEARTQSLHTHLRNTTSSLQSNSTKSFSSAYTDPSAMVRPLTSMEDTEGFMKRLREKYGVESGDGGVGIRRSFSALEARDLGGLGGGDGRLERALGAVTENGKVVLPVVARVQEESNHAPDQSYSFQSVSHLEDDDEESIVRDADGDVMMNDRFVSSAMQSVENLLDGLDFKTPVPVLVSGITPPVKVANVAIQKVVHDVIGKTLFGNDEGDGDVRDCVLEYLVKRQKWVVNELERVMDVLGRS